MMQSELLQPTWPFYNVMTSLPDQTVPNSFNIDTSSSFNYIEEASPTSSFSTMLFNDFVQFSSCDELQAEVENFWASSEDGFSPHENSNETEEDFPSPDLSMEDIWSPSTSMKSSEDSMDTTIAQPSLACQGEEETEVNNRWLSIQHLLKAYVEATEKEQIDLAEVIIRCLRGKVNPDSEILERLLFNLSRDIETQKTYIEEESSKIIDAAVRVFYQIFPYGRFAHYAANSAILEAMPENVETIHIVDFDMGEGIQWPPLIEAMSQHRKTLKLTSIKWEHGDKKAFEETKRRLHDHARSFGLTLKVEEIRVEDLVSEVKKTRKRGSKNEWFAFNCMVGLPHMGRVRSRNLVADFLTTAKELTTDSKNSKHKGIITFGDGDAYENSQCSSGYAAFFERNMMHCQTLIQSMESTLQVRFTEATQASMAMESLFVAPYISSSGWIKNWQDLRKGCQFEITNGLCGWRWSDETLIEVSEMIQGAQSLYGVRISGQNRNEIILEWNRTPLVKVSIYKTA